MKKKIYNSIILVLYPAIDFIAVVLAIAFSYKLYRILGIGKEVYYPKADVILIGLFASFIAVMLLLGFGAYKKESSILNVEEIKNVVKGVTVTFMVFTVMVVFVKLAPSRYVLVFSYIISLVFVVAERTALYHILRLPTSLRVFNRRILIYGAGELGQALYRSIVNSPKLGIVPVGFIDDDLNRQETVYCRNGYNTSNCLRVLGSRKDVRRLKKELDIDEVYVAISNIDFSALTNILDFLKAEKIRVSFVPNLYKVFVHKMRMEEIGQIPIVREENYIDSSYVRVKSYIDLFLSFILLCLSWPLFVVIALAIKMDSKGSIFFRHERVGKDGKIFRLYKFRTMVMDTDPYTVNPLDHNDPRITRVGRLLRKTSLDELPQVINVLKGEMSFVGPRPEMLFIVAGYNEIHKERLKVLPGITGLWQLSGDRKKAIHENMDYDLYYIRNASFFLDVAILIETLIFSFRGI